MNPHLIGLGTWILSKIGDKAFKSLTSEKFDEEKLNERFIKICDKAFIKCKEKYSEDFHDGIKLLLSNDKAISIFYENLFKDVILNSTCIATLSDLSTLPHDFLNDLLLMLRDECMDDTYLRKVFESREIIIAIKGISINIDEIKGHLKISEKELVKIRTLLEDFYNKNFDYDYFLKSYKKVTINSLSQLNFIGLGVDMAIKKGSRKKIQDVFVKPKFSTTTKTRLQKVTRKLGVRRKSNGEVYNLEYSHLFNLSNKIVILGSPGAGKSILLKTIICELLSKRENIFDNKEIYQTFPIRIELRKYLAYKKAVPNSDLIEYVVTLLKTEYSINSITNDLIKEIFNTKSLLILFDGLDEIFDSSDKLAIKQEIESLHLLHSNLYSITTSRLIGYEEAKLNEEFAELNILKFDVAQISDYVNKWYEKEEEEDEVKAKEIKDFLAKSKELDSELITNPLLLALIVILYRNNLKLPESKLEIYQSCTKTLVDKWDATKELKINLDEEILKKKEIVLAALAYWQYEESTRGAEITNHLTRNKVADILAEKFKDENIENYMHPAEAFLSYAEKRSIYFDNNFTHKTFLEYYTAYFIYTNIEKKHKAEDRNRLLLKYIDNPYWYIVFELLFNFIDKDQPDTDIIDGIITMLLNKKETSIPFLLTVLPSLHNISGECTNDVITKSISTLLKLQKSAGRQSSSLKDRIYECLGKLYSNKTFEQTIKSILYRAESEIDEIAVYNLISELYEFNLFPIEPSMDKGLFKVNDIEKYKACLKQDAALFLIDLYGPDTLNLKHNFAKSIIFFRDNFKLQDIFKVINTHFCGVRFAPIIYMYISWQFKDEQIRSLLENLKSLNKDSQFFDGWLGYLSTNDRIARAALEIRSKSIPIPKSKKEVQFIISVLYIYNARPHVDVDWEEGIKPNFTKEYQLIQDIKGTVNYEERYKIFKDFWSLN